MPEPEGDAPATECQPGAHQTNCEHLLEFKGEYKRLVRLEAKLDALIRALQRHGVGLWQEKEGG